MRSGQRFSYLALDPKETRAINAATTCLGFHGFLEQTPA
jgi:hypothetical protein